MVCVKVCVCVCVLEANALNRHPIPFQAMATQLTSVTLCVNGREETKQRGGAEWIGCINVFNIAYSLRLHTDSQTKGEQRREERAKELLC